MREVITRFGRSNLGALWLFLEPMLFTAGVMTLWALVEGHRESSIPIAAFAITGYSSVLVWRNCATHCVMAINTNRALLYHRNVTVLDLVITRCIIEIAGATSSFIILSAFLIWFGLFSLPFDLLEVIGGWVFLAWLGAALGTTLGAAAAYSELVERLWHPISYFLFPLSGAAFMVDWLPEKFQKAVLALPMVHGVEIMREGYFGDTVRTHYDLVFLVCWCLLLSLFGIYLARKAALRVEMQ